MEVHTVNGFQALLDAGLVGPAITVHVASIPNIATAPTMFDLVAVGRHRGWTISPLSRLTDLSCLAFELRRVDNNLVGRLLLNRNDREALFLLKSSAWIVRYLGEGHFNAADVPRKECKRLSNRLLRLSRRVIKGKKDTDWLHERLPDLSDRINNLLNNLVVPLAPLPN